MSSLYIPDFSEMLAVAESRGADSEAPGLWDGLVGARPFAEGGGLTAYDLSGYGNEGTLTNMDPATVHVVGEKGLALDLDGDNDHVNCGTSPFSKVAATSISTLLWAYVDPAAINGDANVVLDTSLGDPAGNNGFYLNIDDRGDNGGNQQTNGFSAALDTSLGFQAAAVNNVFGTAGWYCIGFSYDAGMLQLYLDGNPVGAEYQSDGGTFTPANQILAIGALRDATAPFPGRLTACALWSRGLSHGEFSDLYAEPYAMYTLRSRVYGAAVAGLSIPIAMRHYLQMQGAG